jgi:hypothetical protein
MLSDAKHLGPSEAHFPGAEILRKLRMTPFPTVR